MSETLKAKIKMRVAEQQEVKKKPKFKYALVTCVVLCGVITLVYANERIHKNAPKQVAMADESNVEAGNQKDEQFDEKTGSAKLDKQKYTPKQFEISGGMGVGGSVGSIENSTIDTYSYVGDFTSLPVYENTIKSYGSGRVYEGVSEKEMVSIIEGYCKKLKLDTKHIAYSYDEPLGLVSSITIKEGKYNISINSNGDLRIIIDEKSRAKDNNELKNRTEYETNQKVLFDQYKYLTNINDPVFNSSCAFTSKEELGCTTRIYENRKDEKENFLYQNFKYTTMFSSKSADSSQVFIDIINDNVSSIIGEYQLIGVEKAKETLLQGGYFSTTLIDKDVTEEDIKGVELVYDKKLKPYMFPFYVFYIGQPHDLGGETIGLTYYVPALSIEDLKQFPDIDWYFN